MVPLTIGILAGCAYVDRVGAGITAIAVPENDQADSLVKVEVEVLLQGDWRKIKSIHPSRAATATACPEIEREFAGPKVPVSAIGYRDAIICAIEVKCVADL